MSDEEDYDDLPSITVLSSQRDPSLCEMPSAGEVASQREREERCEQALTQLRGPALPTHSDSSGSEGETYLAAAVTALNVQAEEPRRAVHTVGAGDPSADGALMARLAERAPLDALLQAGLAARRLPPHEQRALYNHVTSQICSAVACSSNTWSTEESLSAATWLGCAPGGRGARRALQRLLDRAPAAARRWADALGAVAPPAALLALGDAARSGAGGAADRAAAQLARAALGGPPTAHRPPPAPRYTAVQAAGRLLAAGDSPRDGELLAHVERATAGLNRHRPDHLKVLVAASKLQLLFRASR